jgi:hypothetical protein
MPTAATNTFVGAGIVPVYAKPEPARVHVKLGNSVSLAAGTVLGEVTATPGLAKAYASGSSDGSQIPKWVLEFPCATDGSGNITVGSTTAGAQGYTTTAKSCPAFMRGCFSTAELTGLDATALTNNPSWNLKSGSVTSGVLELP